MRGIKPLLIGLSFFGMLVNVKAATAATAGASPVGPYQDITQRNVFGLRAPPAQPRTIVDPAPPSASKVILTGITTILGRPLALLKVQTPPRPGQAPAEQSHILTTGQREGGIEVLAINDEAGTVQVNEAGNVMTLDINRDGPKPPASAQPMQPPIQSIPVQQAPVQQGAVQPPVTPANPVSNAAPAVAVPASLLPPPLPPAVNTGLKPMPTRVPRTGAPSQPATQVEQQGQQLTPEEQTLLQEVERAATNAPPR